MEPQMIDTRDEAMALARLCEALRSYQQADHDGVMVLVSREACDKAAKWLETGHEHISQRWIEETRRNEDLARQLAAANERADSGWQMFEENAASAAAANNRALLAEQALAEAQGVIERRDRDNRALCLNANAMAKVLRNLHGLGEYNQAQVWAASDMLRYLASILSPVPREEKPEHAAAMGDQR